MHRTTCATQRFDVMCTDEVHNLLLPRDPTTNLIDTGSQSMAVRLLKELMCKSSTRCMWAVTGSSMAQFWAQMGKVPPNGISPLHMSYKVHLPATHSRDAVALVFNSLQQDGNLNGAAISKYA